MQKSRGSNTRIQIASREKRVPGKSLNITHNKKIANQIEKELLSKIDNILLECQLNNDLIPVFSSKLSSTNISTKTPNSNLEEEQKIEKAPIRPPSADPKLKFPHSTQNLEFDQNMPDININIKNMKRSSKNKLPKVKTKKTSKRHKDGFLTGVGIIKTKKEKRQNKFMAQNDEAINEMLHNIDEIDNFIKNPEEGKDSHLFEGSPDYKDRMAKSKRDFEELINEIDSYKKEMQEDFDIIQYLIKFTNNTEKLIDRHKNVINGIFKGAGLSKKNIDDKLNDSDKKERKTKSTSKSRIQGYMDIVKEVDKMEQEAVDEEDFMDYDDDEFLTTSVSQLNGVFYKMKKINQIKDNLCNIQDDCLGYHEKLKNTLKRSESAKLPERKEEQKI
jgi:hypothetical protein